MIGMVNRPHILTTAKEGTDCSVIAISLREGLSFKAYTETDHPLAEQILQSQTEGSRATLPLGWKLVKSEGGWTVKSDRFQEHPCDIYLSKPRLLNECFGVSSKDVASAAETCGFAWCELTGLKKKTLTELCPLFTIFGKADNIFLFGKTLKQQHSSVDEILTGRVAMCFDVALNTSKPIYFYESNREQWLQYNYGPKKAFQQCEKKPKLSNCCAVVGTEEIPVNCQAYEELFTLLCHNL